MLVVVALLYAFILDHGVMISCTYLLFTLYALLIDTSIFILHPHLPAHRAHALKNEKNVVGGWCCRHFARLDAFLHLFTLSTTGYS